MAQLYRIMVRCPETGNVLDSGIETSGREALDSGLYQDGVVNCRHCGGLHSFEGNAFLNPVGPKAREGLWRPNR